MEKSNNNNGLWYLAGPIEFAGDHGKGWREAADKGLRELGYRVYNPASDEIHVLEPFGVKSPTELAKLKSRDTLGQYRQIMKAIIQFDLRQLERADAILARLDRTLSGGTAAECTIMRWMFNKPVFAIIDPEDIPYISGWVHGCTTHVFKDLEVCLDYTKKWGI